MTFSMTVLRRFAKFLCLSVFFLIFLGGLVKSTESGLSVPDWPTTYGKFMFAYPLNEMTGGIKYEHTHRMLASIVGLMALGMCAMLLMSPAATWLKRLGIWAVVLVILQGILGGMTVIFLLPVWLSSMHGVLAQTLFLMTILLAYGLSIERGGRAPLKEQSDGRTLKTVVILTAMIYAQLIIANLMRHTESGLAIPDFPTMGGTLWPAMDKAMLDRINGWRFEHNLNDVTMAQVHLHFLHRLWAVVILGIVFYLNSVVWKNCLDKPMVMKTVFLLNAAVVMQIVLGAAAVLAMKEPITTTCHVALGAAVLGLSFLLILRSAPLNWQKFLTMVRQ